MSTTPDEKQHYGQLKSMDLDKFWEDIYTHGSYLDDTLVLEYLVKERFAAIEIFNRKKAKELGDKFPGKFIKVVKSTGGLYIYLYEYAIFIAVGDAAYEGGSRQGMILATLNDVIENYLVTLEWGNAEIDFSATHEHLSDIAWVESYRLGVMLAQEEPPTVAAADILNRVGKNIRTQTRFAGKPQLGKRRNG